MRHLREGWRWREAQLQAPGSWSHWGPVLDSSPREQQDGSSSSYSYSSRILGQHPGYPGCLHQWRSSTSIPTVLEQTGSTPCEAFLDRPPWPWAVSSGHLKSNRQPWMSILNHPCTLLLKRTPPMANAKASKENPNCFLCFYNCITCHCHRKRFQAHYKQQGNYILPTFI